jgi:hypothetical protein
MHASRYKKEGFDSRANHRSARKPTPLPFRIDFPKDAEEKVFDNSELTLYIRIFRAKRTKLLGG